MKFVLIIFAVLNGAPVAGEIEGTFPTYTDKVTACAALVETAKKLGALAVAGCEIRIDI